MDIRVKVTGSGGTQEFMVDRTLVGPFIRTLELSVNTSPVVRVPFAMHDPDGGLHTVCRKNGEIERVEW